MTEIGTLIQRADKYLQSARVLIEEADYESAVSRTYYAMFYAAQTVLLSKKLAYSSHKAVLSGFGEHFVKTDILPKRLGRNLNLAFQKRQLSDYETRFVISKTEAEDLLELGKEFVVAITAYLETNNLLSN